MNNSETKQLGGKQQKPILLAVLLLVVVVCGGIGAAVLVGGGVPMVKVDFDNVIGTFKSLNGINNGPKSGYSENEDGTSEWALDVTDIYNDLGISFVRLHDTEYPYGGECFVDIHCIFPDEDADVDDPDSYDFSCTDEYIANIKETSAEILYRLGESISESSDNLVYTHPPEDYEKWAQVCEHIIRHYNEGWANGYYYDIQYWEIWNEPDVNRQWSGTMEQYYEMYKVTARYLKECYPDIMVGGGALGSATEETVSAFLEGICDDGEDTPLDFFSWHLYTTTAEEIAIYANTVRDTLDSYGYSDTLSFLDEWNYVTGWDSDSLTTTWEVIHSYAAASFYTSCLITMQNSPVDSAMYYDGQYAFLAYWNGLYTSEDDLSSGYYAFDFFNQLCETGQQVEVSVDETLDSVYCCAAAGDGKGVLLTNVSYDKVKLSLCLYTGVKNATVTKVNASNPDGVTETETWLRDCVSITLSAYETMYIALQ
ncbi:MAG: hypothetical protein LUG65_06075 [Clostridiales bacterium]|nr:hypothetical protein [Clostridiales bacterium]